MLQGQGEDGLAVTGAAEGWGGAVPFPELGMGLQCGAGAWGAWQQALGFEGLLQCEGYGRERG